MLDKTTEVRAQGKIEIPAISVQYHVQFSDQRGLTLTTGVPLDADPTEINPVLDKLVDCVERQRDRYNLIQAKNLLLNAEQDLHNFQVQRQTKESEFSSDWAGRRQGPWEPSHAQKKALGDLQVNVDNASTRIQQLQKTVKELEEKCR